MEFDNSKFKVWTWKSPIMLHWIVNPILVINEMILGQRVPKISLIEKNSNKSFAVKTYVPCPHCETIHSGLKWSSQNKTAYKNWFGLYCDNCGKIIPCLTNLTTYLVLGLTFPFWYFFKDKWKENWLKKQPERFTNLNLETVPNPFSGNGWIMNGLSWGLFMYAFMTFLFPFIDGEGITTRRILIGIPIWIIAGLGYGYMMKLIYGRNEKKIINNSKE